MSFMKFYLEANDPNKLNNQQLPNNNDDQQNDDTPDFTENNDAQNMNDTNYDNIEQPQDDENNNQDQLQQPSDQLPEDNSTTNPNSPSANIDSLEKDAFANLKPSQVIIKNKELKGKFIDIFDAINDNFEKMNRISRNVQDATVIEFCIRKMMDLKNEVKDYLIDTYTSKSYIENKIQLYTFTVIYKQISNILEELAKTRKKAKDDSLKKISVNPRTQETGGISMSGSLRN